MIRIAVDIGQYHFTDERGNPIGWRPVTIPEWWQRLVWQKAGGCAQDRMITPNS